MVIHRIHKSGGSYAVVIPKTFLNHLNLMTGDYVTVILKKDFVEVKPLRKYPRTKKFRRWKK